MSARRVLRAVRVGLVVAAVVVMVGGLTAAARRTGIQEGAATAATLALAVVLVGAVGGWFVGSAGAVRLGVLVQFASLVTALGVLRHLNMGSVPFVVRGGAWLVGPALVLGCVAVDEDEPAGARRAWQAVVLGSMVVLGVAAAMVGGAAGPGSWTAVTIGSPLVRASRILLGLHVLVFGLAIPLVAFRRGGSGSRAVRSDARPVFVAVLVWGLAAWVGEAIHLRFGPRIFEVVDGVPGYRDGAAVVGLHLPLLATMGLLATVVYCRVLRPRLRRSPTGALLLAGRELETVDQQLAVWMADPTVRLAFRADDGGWVDRAGSRVVPDTRPGRAVTTLTSKQEPVALIEHDAELGAQPGVIEVAAAIASMAIDAEANAALGAQRVAESQRVGARLLDAEDDARRILGDELAAGPVADLRACADALVAGLDLVEASERIRAATTSLRLISHGLLPPELEDGGLASALPDAGAVPAERLPRAAEVTAYLLARDVAGAHLVRRKGWLEIDLPVAPTDPHAIDRVLALGGRLDGCRVEIPIGGR